MNASTLKPVVDDLRERYIKRELPASFIKEMAGLIFEGNKKTHDEFLAELRLIMNEDDIWRLADAHQDRVRGALSWDDFFIVAVEVCNNKEYREMQRALRQERDQEAAALQRLNTEI